MTYKQICLDRLDRVKEVMERLVNEPELRVERYIERCDITYAEDNVYCVSLREIHGGIDIDTGETRYNAEEIDGLNIKYGDYEEIRNAILNAPDDVIENSRYAVEWDE
jgi:hypothetical protein